MVNSLYADQDFGLFDSLEHLKAVIIRLFFKWFEFSPS